MTSPRIKARAFGPFRRLPVNPYLCQPRTQGLVPGRTPGQVLRRAWGRAPGWDGTGRMRGAGMHCLTDYWTKDHGYKCCEKYKRQVSSCSYLLHSHDTQPPPWYTATSSLLFHRENRARHLWAAKAQWLLKSAYNRESTNPQTINKINLGLFVYYLVISLRLFGPTAIQPTAHVTSRTTRGIINKQCISSEQLDWSYSTQL